MKEKLNKKILIYSTAAVMAAGTVFAPAVSISAMQGTTVQHSIMQGKAYTEETGSESLYFAKDKYTVAVGSTNEKIEFEDDDYGITSELWGQATVTSSNEGIATVTKKEFYEDSYCYVAVQGISAGTCIITLNYNGKDYSVMIDVKESTLCFENSTYTFKAGTSKEIEITDEMRSITDDVGEKVVFVSSDESIAKVTYDEDYGEGWIEAYLIANNPGTCTITANVGGKEITCNVVVEAAVYKFSGLDEKLIEGDTSKHSLWIEMEDSEDSLKATSDIWKNAVFSSSDEKVIKVKKVEDGAEVEISVVGSGSAAVTGTIAGQTFTQKIQVEKLKVTVKESLSAYEGCGFHISDLYKTNSSDSVEIKNLKSSNKKVVSIKDGSIFLSKAGRAKVSFKIAGKTYKTNFVVKKNDVKTYGDATLEISPNTFWSFSLKVKSGKNNIRADLFVKKVVVGNKKIAIYKGAEMNDSSNLYIYIQGGSKLGTTTAKVYLSNGKTLTQKIISKRAS